MKKIALLLLAIICSKLLAAQFNDSTHYYLSYASTGIINKTNDGNSYVLNNVLKFNVVRKKLSINSFTGWVYGKQQGTLSNNDVSSIFDFNFNSKLPHFYYWGLATYDKSYSLKINSRFQAGLGIAYRIVEQKNAALSISDGILFEKSDLFLHDTIPDKYHTFRNSLRVKFRYMIKDLIVLDGSDFWQPSLSYKDDYIFKSTTTLTLRLKKWLGLNTAVTYNKLNRTGRENLLITYGLTVEKYF